MNEETDELAQHIISQMHAHDAESALDHPFPYHCRQCRCRWKMNFHELMLFTERDVMPCGCTWQHLDFRRAIGDMVQENKIE